MPVRMEKDPDNQGSNRSQNQRRTGGGGNMLIRFLPLLIMFLIKRPKLLIPVLILGAAWYFFFGGQEMLGGFSANTDSSDFPSFSLGALLDESRYDQAQVFEPLATSYGFGAGLPSSVSLLDNAPQRRHQGSQGSCVGWASAYAAQSILVSKATGRNPNSTAFSPAYLYNQIALEGCEGAYLLEAMKAMQSNGALPFNQFGYTDQSCAQYPSNQERQLGQQFRIKGYNRLTVGGSNYKPDINGIRQNLAQGAPVVIGMMVGGTFMSRMVGQRVWRPTSSDMRMGGFSGHAMCVIGYDDNLEGGAFQIMNSWGENWGDRGVAWVKYRDFAHFTKEAYGLHPMGSAGKFDPNKLAVEFGLFDINKKAIIPLQKSGDIVFKTVSPIQKNDKFKVLIANSIECNIYVFGQESDGSSYVLFPYTEKHSPYCGITGTRLFPKDYSMKVDDIGNKDYIAILITKEAINFNQFNNRLNSSRQGTYVGKLREAIQSQQITNIQFQTKQTVAFNANTKGKNAVGMIIEIDKR